MTTILRGDIFYADLRPTMGSEQGGLRPVLIIQNDQGNLHAPTVIVAAITSQLSKAKLPTHVNLPATLSGLKKDSVVLAEQIRTIDKQRLRDKVTHLGAQSDIMQAVGQALAISLHLHKKS
jgi:mRNA interferase MazF